MPGTNHRIGKAALLALAGLVCLGIGVASHLSNYSWERKPIAAGVAIIVGYLLLGILLLTRRLYLRQQHRKRSGH